MGSRPVNVADSGTSNANQIEPGHRSRRDRSADAEASSSAGTVNAENVNAETTCGRLARSMEQLAAWSEVLGGEDSTESLGRTGSIEGAGPIESARLIKSGGTLQSGEGSQATTAAAYSGHVVTNESVEVDPVRREGLGGGTTGIVGPETLALAEQHAKVDAGYGVTRRWRALRNHGDFTLAYNTAVQEGLEYFWWDEHYVAFARRKGHVFVLGDPVASPAALPELVNAFLREHPGATFVQVSSSTAAVLESCGYYINEMGVDTILDLPEYSFAGKAMERIRYASNWLKKHGYTIEESSIDEASAEEVRQVSDGWRRGMRYRRSEMRFLNRPIRFHEEQDVRKFFLRDSEGRLVAFFYFDPLYRDGQVIGYTTSIKRRLPEAPLYAEQGIMRMAVERFKSEGKLQVNLGLSPLAWIENQTFRCNRLMHYSFRYAFRAWWVNRYFYNLEGHAQYKRHFRGREVHMHYASPVIFNDLRIMNLMRLTGIY